LILCVCVCVRALTYTHIQYMHALTTLKADTSYKTISTFVWCVVLSFRLSLSRSVTTPSYTAV